MNIGRSELEIVVFADTVDVDQTNNQRGLLEFGVFENSF